jgi:hypothetical protein
VRAWQDHGPTREEVWRQREPISATIRDNFRADVAAELQKTIPQGDDEASLSAPRPEGL